MKSTADAIASELTPSPWIVETRPTQYPDLFTYHVIAPAGYVESDGTIKRCAVTDGLDSIADARLIAAAPDLLMALSDLHESAEQYLAKQSVDTINGLTAALRFARVAMSKAEEGPR